MENDKEVLITLGRLEGKIETLTSVMASQAEATKMHDKRLRELESSRSALLGAVFILSAAVSTAIAWLTR